MKPKSLLSIHVLAILLLAIISGINNIPYVAGSTQFTVEGYNLIPYEGWITENVNGYCEDDFVPIRLNCESESQPATTLVFRVGGDHYDEVEDAYGFDYFSEFTISGDYFSATIDYAGSPDGPYNFPWSGGPGTGEMIHLPGDRGLTVRYIIEVQIPPAGAVQKEEFTIEFFAHETLTEFSDVSIVKRGSYYWGSANLLVGKDPSDAGQNTVPVSKCDEEPQPPTTEDCYLGDGGISNFGKIRCEGPNVIVGVTEMIGTWHGAVGTVPADWIDATSAAILWGASSGGVFYWDFDSTEVNQATGETQLAGHEIMSGGPIVNGPVKYYEDNKIAPVYYKASGGYSRFFESETETQIPGAELRGSEIGSSKDMFVIQLFQKSDTESNPEYVMICYGFAGRGTLASSIYFKTVIEPSLSTYTDSYYIVQWYDTNGNAHPDMPSTDTYTLIASGN